MVQKVLCKLWQGNKTAVTETDTTVKNKCNWRWRNGQDECDFNPQKKLCKSWSESVLRKLSSIVQPARPSSIMGTVVDVESNRMSVSLTYFYIQTVKHAVQAIKRSAVGCFCRKDANYIPDNQELCCLMRSASSPWRAKQKQQQELLAHQQGTAVSQTTQSIERAKNQGIERRSWKSLETSSQETAREKQQPKSISPK